MLFLFSAILILFTFSTLSSISNTLNRLNVVESERDRWQRPSDVLQGLGVTQGGTVVELASQPAPVSLTPRIHGELKMLGIAISECTVSRIIRTTRSRPPSQTWQTFLRNQFGQIVSVDFFTVPTIRLRVLFVFLLLEHRRREVLHFSVTDHPTSGWVAQQMVEAFADREVTRYLIRDRDNVYGNEVRGRQRALLIEEIVDYAIGDARITSFIFGTGVNRYPAGRRGIQCGLLVHVSRGPAVPGLACTSTRAIAHSRMREGEAPAVPKPARNARLGRSLALPNPRFRCLHAIALAQALFFS